MGYGNLRNFALHNLLNRLQRQNSYFWLYWAPPSIDIIDKRTSAANGPQESYTTEQCIQFPPPPKRKRGQ
uniref:Uncharacterized protein n=1 Tax=Anguilla anguilla TaxID=7936 RepID=A0A0E9WQP4_ANGAN